MAKLFDFNAEFKLGIDGMDNQHIKLIDMLNEVHELLADRRENEARVYFADSLSAYVNEHFSSEEKFLQSMGYTDFEQHKKIHDSFKRSFQELAPSIRTGSDDESFRKALSDTYHWIINHIGKVDRKYASFYLSKNK